MKSLIYITIALFVTLAVGGAWAQQAKGPATADQIKQELLNLQQQVNQINNAYYATLYKAEQQANKQRDVALAPIQQRAQELQAQLRALQSAPVEPCEGEDCK